MAMRASAAWLAAALKPIEHAYDKAAIDTKLALSLIIVGAVGFMSIFLALTAVITPSFSKLESESVASSIERTKAALDEYSLRVESTVKDYGAWDDSFEYVAAPTRKFESDTSSVLAMTNLNVNGMAFARFDGAKLLTRWIDLDNKVEVPSLARELEGEMDRLAGDPRVKHRESLRYYVRFGDRVAAISVAKIVRTDGSGEPLGFVAMAREINSKQLSELLQVKARLSLADRKPAPQLTARTEEVDIAVNIPGLHTGRVAQAKFSVPRRLAALGQSSLLLAVISSAIVLMLALLALRWLMHRVVIKPMTDIEGHMQRVTFSGELQPLGGHYSNDQMGSLVFSFNSMLKQLKDLREQLEIQSFRLGRTESAVGVMHNVRNGLNPISVILSKAVTDEPSAAPHDIVRAIDELSQSDTLLDRREKLGQFLKLARNAGEAQRDRRIAEMQTARECLANVVDLIGKQQAAAHEHIDTESCNIADVIRQNAALARYSLDGNVRFVVEDGEHIGLANRVLLSQVVGNIFSNAAESIKAMQRETGAIEVSFVEHDDMLDIIIRDNGEGFAPDRTKKLFERGFSTRKEKSGGLGLHWCANAVTLMNGRLSLESDGLGLGAKAIITLPMLTDKQEAGSEDRAARVPIADIDPEAPALKIQNHQ